MQLTTYIIINIIGLTYVEHLLFNNPKKIAYEDDHDCILFEFKLTLF